VEPLLLLLSPDTRLFEGEHMPTLTSTRFAYIVLVLLSLGLLVAPGLLSSKAQKQKIEFEVHEWGTFTSVAGRAGTALEWRPLTTESDLPSFVYSIDRISRPPQQRTQPTSPQPQAAPTPRSQPRELRYPTKSATPVSVRMETPVLYFYAKQETTIRVSADFLNGKITEWYPQSRSVHGGSIDWGQIRLLPATQMDLPNDFRQNHYYPARETDAAPLQVTFDGQNEYEKFLFYRGVGNVDLPLWVKLEGDTVRIRQAYGEHVNRLVLFENRGGKIGFQIHDMRDAELVVNRPALNGKVEVLRQRLKAMLLSQGLYEKEANAMLETWRDSWFEEGLRVFYILPRSTTDEILPINIEPQPSQLVRVLVGRTELITPEMEVSVINEIRKLESPSMSVRKAALEAINKYGRFREPILKQIFDHTDDPQLRASIERLLRESGSARRSTE
jgi:hypothetical protein